MTPRGVQGMGRLVAVVLVAALGLLVGRAEAQPSSLLGDEQRPAPGTVWGERARYGASMTREQVAALLNAVAWAHRDQGWGLLRKGSGNSCPLGDTFISCDILVDARGGHHFDVLIDAENRARPTWNDVGPCVLGPASGCEMSRFLAPLDPATVAGGVGAPVGPTAPPASVGPDVAALVARLDAFERALQAIAAQFPGLERRVDEAVAAGRQASEVSNTVQALAAVLTGTVERVGVLESRPIPTECQAFINFGLGRATIIPCRLK